MTSMRLVTAAAIALVGLAIGEARGAEMKIGVVNVREIIARYKKHEDLKRLVAGKLEPMRKELARRSAELQKNAQEVQLSTPDDKDGEDEKYQKMRGLEKEEFLLKLEYREFQRQVKQYNDQISRLIMEEINAACRRVGEAQGYYLIIKRYGVDPNATSDRDHVEAFQLDSLLYISPEADITSTILDLLEDAYRRGLQLVPSELSDELGKGDDE